MTSTVTAFDPSTFNETDPASVWAFIRHAHACSSEGFCLFCRVRLIPAQIALIEADGQKLVGSCPRCGNEYLHAKIDLDTIFYSDEELLGHGKLMASELRRYGLL